MHDPNRADIYDMGAARVLRAPRPAGDAFAQTPYLVFWETTRACDLACQHCRASARSFRDPRELSTREAFALLDELADAGCRLFVLTGGDPAKREDLVDIVRYGTSAGLRMALTPSATPLVTAELLAQLRDAGLARVAVSLDGAVPETHDAFRGVAGSFDRTLEIFRHAREIGLTTQANTTVTRDNVRQLDTIAALVGDMGVELWSVFFVVPTGRARPQDLLRPEDIEAVLEKLADLMETAPYDIKTTAAPHFRRVLLTRQVAKNEIVGLADGIGRAPRSVNDGQGIAFVSHRGDVYPSGFMPLPCGNIRERGLLPIYREHPLFVALRDPDELTGKCGACEFRRVCGGSRARAYALTGDGFASDPSCIHVPKGWA